MKFNCRKNWAALLLVLLFVPGCSKPESKPESKLVGKWVNEKTMNSIEFTKEHTGAISQHTNSTVPHDIQFTWTMLDDHQFKVEIGAPGNAGAPVGKGRLEGDDTLILENDTFTKAKQ